MTANFRNFLNFERSAVCSKRVASKKRRMKKNCRFFVQYIYSTAEFLPSGGFYELNELLIYVSSKAPFDTDQFADRSLNLSFSLPQPVGLNKMEVKNLLCCSIGFYSLFSSLVFSLCPESEVSQRKDYFILFLILFNPLGVQG